MPLDIPTLFVVSICITALLGLVLVVLWIQDRATRALGWWAIAYLIGGFAVMLWLLQPMFQGSWPNDLASALLFAACGMIWSGARMFHGRRVRPVVMLAGAVAWLTASQIAVVASWDSARIVLPSLIITGYVVLTAIELNRERRNPEATRLRAIVMPALHGAIFLSPIFTNYLIPHSAHGTNDGFFALFALLTLLYVIGTACIVVVMAKDNSLQLHKTAAVTDPLTGLLNRRGFFDYAQTLIEARFRKRGPISVLMFDLDNFKSINDRFGHDIGDEALRVFAATVSARMRSEDIIGRLGGEEFAAVLPSGMDSAIAVANRVRLAFEAAGRTIAGQHVGATVSVGAAGWTMSSGTIQAMLARADAALYRAKFAGRNRVIADDGAVMPEETSPPIVPDVDSQLEWVPAEHY